MIELTTLQIKQKAKQELFDDPDIMGIGIGKGSSDQINIYVKRKTPEIIAKIPKVLNGAETRIIESGTIKALPLMSRHLPQAMDVSRTERVRPAFGGLSCGHCLITAGTFSTLVRDNLTGKNAILSNCHVFNPDPRITELPTYDIYQPGPHDGGTATDLIAHTVRWIPLDPFKVNIVDCALAIPLNDADISNDILGLGPATGTAVAQVDDTVSKSGRTTAVTSASVIDVNADVKVGYETSDGVQFTAEFTDQIVTENCAAGGDSGSALMNQNNEIVGLLFAGSDTLTVHNKIQNVMNYLNISIGGAVTPPPVQASLMWLAIPLGLTFLYYLFKK